MNQENITLGEIDQGKLVLHANRELKRIIADIADPNKKATTSRELQINVKFTPNKQRSAATVKFTVKSKPATHIETESEIYLGKDKLGEPIAKPWVPNQQDMPFVGDEDSDRTEPAAS